MTLSVVGQIERDSGDSTVQAITSCLPTLEPAVPISLWIDSTGGSYDDAVQVYGALSALPNPKRAYVSMHCQSAAMLLLATATERIASPAAEFHVHQPALERFSGLRYTVEARRSSELKLANERLQGVTDTYASIIAQLLRDPTDNLWKSAKKGKWLDRTFGTAKALELGLLTAPFAGSLDWFQEIITP